MLMHPISEAILCTRYDEISKKYRYFFMNLFFRFMFDDAPKLPLILNLKGFY